MERDHNILRRAAAPNAVVVVHSNPGTKPSSLRITAVRVMKPRGRDGDLLQLQFSLLGILVRLGLRAGLFLLIVDAGALAGADVCAACSGVDAADGGQRTVDVHLHIGQRRAGACPSGGIDYRNELCVTGAAVAAPLIHVVDVDAFAAGYHQLSVLSDGDLHAGQQCRSLVDGQLAASRQIDGHVVG